MVEPSQAVVPALCSPVGRGPIYEEAGTLRGRGAWAWPHSMATGLQERGIGSLLSGNWNFWCSGLGRWIHAVLLVDLAAAQSSNHRGLPSDRVMCLLCMGICALCYGMSALHASCSIALSPRLFWPAFY